MKRLSTIIRPGHAKDKSASQSSDTKPASESEPVPATTTETNGTTDPKPAENSESVEPPKESTTDAAAPAEAPATTDGPAATNGDVDKAPEQPAEASTEAAKDEQKDEQKAEKAEGKPETKTESKAESTTPSTKRERSARDIGRNTIRRFSSILRAQMDFASKEAAPPVPKSDAAAIDAPAAPAPAPVDAPAEPIDAPAATDKPAAEAKPDATVPPPTPPKPKKDTKDKKDKKDKSVDEKDKTKRRSSFFQGLQRNRDKYKPKDAKEKVKAEAIAKIVKKGAAKGKRVVVITGSSQGPGLEFVKQFVSISLNANKLFLIFPCYSFRPPSPIHLLLPSPVTRTSLTTSSQSSPPRPSMTTMCVHFVLKAHRPR